MPQNKASYHYIDHDGESSIFSVNIGPLTAANFTAKRAAIDDLKTALAGIVRGGLTKTSILEQFGEGGTQPVTDPLAQREVKWLVVYRDVTQFLDVGNTIANAGFGNLSRVDLPTADLTLLPDGSGELDLTDTAVAAFVTAFEAVMNSPTGGNEVSVERIEAVGRAI